MMKKNSQRGTRAGEGISGMEVGKYLSMFAILLYIVLLVIYASGSTKPFDEVANTVEAGLEDRENLVKEKSQALKRYYGLNSADYEGVLLYTSELSTSAEEILLIEARDDRQVQEIRDAVEQRLTNRKSSFERFAPEQADVLEDAVLLVRGRFVFLAVSSDAETYGAIFTNSL